jgi:hypothetical protein
MKPSWRHLPRRFSFFNENYSTMVAQYQGSGFRMIYPENWTLEEAADDQQSTSVSIESPEGPFFTVNHYRNFSDVDSLLSQAIEAMRQEYPDLEEDPIDDATSWHADASVELSFYYLDLLIVTRIFVLKSAADLLVVQIQGESRDFDRLEPVFLGMMKSLTDSLL